MKNKIKLLVVTLAGLIFAGCVSSQPGQVTTETTPAGQVSVTNPPTYSVSPGFINAASNLQATVAAVAPTIEALAPPVAPLVPIGQQALAGVLATIAAVSTGIAAWKNNQAKAHAAAAAVLAKTGVFQSGANFSSAAISNSIHNGSTALVAQHLQNAAKPV